VSHGVRNTFSTRACTPAPLPCLLHLLVHTTRSPAQANAQVTQGRRRTPFPTPDREQQQPATKQMRKLKSLTSADLEEETRRMEAQLSRIKAEKDKLARMVPA
jgi:hypothetical protein